MQALDFPSIAECLDFPSANRASLAWVQFDSSGGSSVPLQVVIPGAKIIPPKDPSRTGYIFAGWWYDDGAYAVKWDFGRPAYPCAGAGITALKFPSKACAGYYEGYTGRVVSSNNITLYAKWEAIVYPIIYHLDGGSQGPGNPYSYTIETPDITLADPSRPGHIFKGWYADSSFLSTSAGIPRGSTGIKNFYAKWDIITYTITYTLNGGINSPENPAVYTVTQSSITFADPSRPGYTFAGWYDNPDFSGSPVIAIPAGDIGNRAFYAAWTLDTYTIEYVLGGGKNSGDNPGTYTVYDDITFLPAAKDGYEFAGWFTDQQFSGSPVYRIVSGTTGFLRLFARWARANDLAVGVPKDRYSGDPRFF
jgi:uncharacterized repeat protein (TIGR02543 family)